MKNRFSPLQLAEGVLLILLGLGVLFYPGRMLSGFIMICGGVAVVTGILDIVHFVRVERYMGFGPVLSMVSGTLSVMTGIMLLAHPDAGKWVLAVLFPIWFIAHCISRLASLNSSRFFMSRASYYCRLVLDSLGLILGFCMLFDPITSLVSLQYIAAAYLILLGIDCLVEAFSA